MNSSSTANYCKPLEHWLNRATNPDVEPNELVNLIKTFCDQLNNELEGPQIACRLISHKIQSPQENEALNALAVCEACVRNCGPRFHNEIGKFRFLNELIKILSPKYLGNRTPERVKTRTVELLYSWGTTLKHQPKIKQAYDMLKQQGIVHKDPVYMDEIIHELPASASTAPRLATFEDEDKAKLLSTLLKSNNPDDLISANRLIKSMVKEEERKQEKCAKRSMELQAMKNNSKLLTEMLQHYTPGSVNEQELEIMKELNDSLLTNRPTLFRYASEASEEEEGAATLADVLSINDEVGKAVDEFKRKIGFSQPKRTTLLSLDEVRPPAQNFSTDIPSSSSEASCDDVSLLGGLGTPLMGQRKVDNLDQKLSNNLMDDLSSIFSSQANAATPSSYQPKDPTSILALYESKEKETVDGLVPLRAPSPSKSAASQGKLSGASGDKLVEPELQSPTSTKRRGLTALDELSQSLIQKNLPAGTSSASEFVRQKAKLPLSEMPVQQGSNPKNPSPSQRCSNVNDSAINDIEDGGDTLLVLSTANSAPVPETGQIRNLSPSPAVVPCPLENVELVSLEQIQPIERDPVEIVCQNNIRVHLYYMKSEDLSPDVLPAVISITSSNLKRTDHISFSLRLSDSEAESHCSFKLQDAGLKHLPGYNPIAPQPSISQVLLIALHRREKKNVGFIYTMSFVIDGIKQTLEGRFKLDIPF